MNDLINRLRSGAVMPGDLDIAAEQMQAQTEANAALRAQIDALTAERDAARDRAVRVKPLVWRESNCGNFRKGECYHASSYVSFAPIAVHRKHDGWWLNSDCKTYPTLEAAQTAGQAIETARIRAALDPAPVSDEALIRAAVEIVAEVYDEAEKAHAMLDGKNHANTIVMREVARTIRTLLTAHGIAAIRERAQG